MISRQEPVQPPVQTGQAIQALALNFARATCTPTPTPRLLQWKKPMQNQLALNVDAAYLEESSTGACGAILRNNRGLFVAASTAKLYHVADVLSAEAAALAESLKLANTVGSNSLLVQSDSLVLVEALQNNSGHSIVADPILEECRLLLINLGNVVIEHCNRDSNKVAHVLAQNGRVDPPNLWLDSPLAFILKLLVDNVSVV